MDTLSIGTALLACRRDFYDPLPLLDDDLRVLYAHKGGLQPRHAGPFIGSVVEEFARVFTHFHAALRIALSGLATG